MRRGSQAGAVGGETVCVVTVRMTSDAEHQRVTAIVRLISVPSLWCHLGGVSSINDTSLTIHKAFRFGKADELVPLDGDQLLHPLIVGQRWFGSFT